MPGKVFDCCDIMEVGAISSVFLKGLSTVGQERNQLRQTSMEKSPLCHFGCASVDRFQAAASWSWLIKVPGFHLLAANSVCGCNLLFLKLLKLHSRLV